MSGELPKGWATASIGLLTDYVQRGKPPKYATKSDLPVINQKCVRWWGVDSEHLKYVAEEQWPSWAEERFIQDGDILWNSTGTGTIGRAVLFRKLPDIKRIVCDSHVTIVRANKACNHRYLYWFIRSPRVQDKINEMQAGSTNQVEFARGEVLATQVPLAPAPEQQRLVRKIDTLFTRSSRARDELSYIPKLIDRYRQATLSSLYEESTNEAANRATLQQVALSVQNGLSRRPEDTTPGTPILRISAVRVGLVAVDDVRYYQPSEGEDISNYYLDTGDALFVRFNGNPHYVGVCGIFRGESRTFVYPDKLIRVRLNRDAVTADYIEAMFATPQVRDQMRHSIKTAAGQHGISGGDLKAIPFPLPSLPTQKRLITKVRMHLATISVIERELIRATSMIDRLDRAILDKAFNGQLVPQDPNDEPASKLLERIKAARAAMPQVKRGRRPKGA